METFQGNILKLNLKTTNAFTHNKKNKNWRQATNQNGSIQVRNILSSTNFRRAILLPEKMAYQRYQDNTYV